ncbi:restriction endonuclease subunit S [Bacteroides fragilis]
MRFPEFSGEWDSFKLVELGKFIGGGTPSSSNLSFWTGSIPWISSSDIKEDNINNISISRYITEEAIEKSATKYCPAPVILIVSRVGVGKVALSHTSLCTSQDFCNIIEIKCHPVFLSYNLLRTMKRKSREVQGTSIKGITSDELQKMRVFIPKNKDEQNKISNLLTLLDERIATQNKIIEDLQSLISGLNDFLHLQVGGLSTSFEELGTSYSGLSGKSGDDFGKGKPYITYLNIYSNSIVNEEQVDYVVIGDNEKQNTLLYGDLLFTLSSETPDEVGIGAVYLGESDKYYLNSFCFGLHMTATNKVYSPYLAYLVSNNVFRKFIYPLAQGSTRFNLQKNDFMKKKFLLPTFESQKEIARTLNALSSKLETERKLLLNYQEQKQYLLGSMFI